MIVALLFDISFIWFLESDHYKLSLLGFHKNLSNFKIRIMIFFFVSTNLEIL